MRHVWPLAGCAALLIAGCAGNPDPIIDPRGVNMTAYEADLAECKALAEGVEVGKGAVKGAAAGAAVGGAIGAIRDRDAGEAAGVGAVVGGARSAQLNERERQQVVKRCLRGRGYRVLN
jgi:hypothetical protein